MLNIKLFLRDFAQSVWNCFYSKRKQIVWSNQQPCFILPYLRDGHAATLAQRWGCIRSAQCASPNVTIRLQEHGYEAVNGCEFVDGCKTEIGVKSDS